MRRGNGRNRWRGIGFVGGFAALATLACNFDVTNPGPAQDAFLDNPEAHPAVVNGAKRAFNNAWNEMARRGASAAREVFPSGNTGRIGINVEERRGILDVESSLWWNLAANARWVAEDAVRRFARVLDEAAFSRSKVVADAYLWAGYNNRLNGEHFCEAVIDGTSRTPIETPRKEVAEDLLNGELEPHTVYFQRAEQAFTRAMEIARAAGDNTIALAAQGGRASVRLSLRKFQEARADAQAVLAADPNFRFQARFSTAEEAQYNWMKWAVANSPYRVFTVWHTVYEEYFPATGDPRTPWGEDPEFPTGTNAVGPFGKVPWLFQLKYDRLDDPVDLTDAREMKLIIAETLLEEGRWEEALGLINEIRTSVISLTTGEPLEPWEAANAQEAWTALKRERGIELWLEGRRLGDLRRWADAGTPGELDFWEVPHPDLSPDPTFLDPNRDLCHPVPNSERETNPNIPIT